MPFCPNKTIFVTSRLKNCSNKTGCFSTLQGHTVNFARPRLKFACLCQKFEIRQYFVAQFSNTACEAEMLEKLHPEAEEVFMSAW